jgi:hypothetical protein
MSNRISVSYGNFVLNIVKLFLLHNYSILEIKCLPLVFVVGDYKYKKRTADTVTIVIALACLDWY